MPIETKIKYNNFVKAVDKFLLSQGLSYNFERKSGSARRFEVFGVNKDRPEKMWVVHENKKIYSDDLKKTCLNLGITIKEFEKYLD